MRSLEDEITRRHKSSPSLFAKGQSPAEENLKGSVFSILQQDYQILREIDFEQASRGLWTRSYSRKPLTTKKG